MSNEYTPQSLAEIFEFAEDEQAFRAHIAFNRVLLALTLEGIRDAENNPNSSLPKTNTALQKRKLFGCKTRELRGFCMGAFLKAPYLLSNYRTFDELYHSTDMLEESMRLQKENYPSSQFNSHP